MVDYRFAEYSPLMYHATNLFLHCCNALLVFWFVYLLLEKQFLAAVLTSLVFAIHPMHVESVAWISGRKDLLSALGMLLSLIAYLKYLEKLQWKWITWSFLFFVFALFAKVIAIVLPFILVLVDYYRKRKLNKLLIIEKIPFVISAIAIAAVGFLAQSYGHAVRDNFLFDSFWVSQYAIVFYIVKYFMPLNLSALYPYPAKVHGAFPPEIYMASIFLLALAYILWRKRNDETLLFGFLFFLLFILPVVQFIRFSNIVAADRFSYVSYIGLTLPFSMWIQRYFLQKERKTKNFLLFVVIVVLLGCAYGSYERCFVWESSTTLWLDVLKQFPNALN